MQLEWQEHRPTDSEGIHHLVHYLVDLVNQRCYAMVAEPRDGHILYQSDLRCNGEDRSYVTIGACKDYCEAQALKQDIGDAAELEERVGITNSTKEWAKTAAEKIREQKEEA